MIKLLGDGVSSNGLADNETGKDHDGEYLREFSTRYSHLGDIQTKHPPRYLYLFIAIQVKSMYLYRHLL